MPKWQDISIAMAEAALCHIPNEEVICLKWTKEYFISEVEAKSKWRNLRDQFQRELKKVKKLRSGESASISVSDYKGKWVFFEMLFFLKDTMVLTKMTSNFDNVPSTDTLNSETDTNSEDLGQEVADTTEASERITPPRHLETFDTHSSRFEESPEIPRLHNTSIYHHSRGRKRTLSDFGRDMLEMEKKKLPAFVEHGLCERHEQDDEDMHFAKSLVPSLRRLDPIRKLIIRNKIQSLLIKELIHENSSLSSDSQAGTSTGDPLTL